MDNLSPSDILKEFVQWLANDEARLDDLTESIEYDDPEAAEQLIEEFLSDD